MIFVYLTILLLICYVILRSNKLEGFTVNKTNNFIETKTYRDERIYDDFYSYIYDDLFVTIPYIQELIQSISTLLNKNSNVLCIGSKTGHIVQLLSNDVSVRGLENSLAMVKIAKYKYPKNIYSYGNYLDHHLFKENQFTHIVLPMLSFNTIEDLNQLFVNANKWLVHNGFMIMMSIDLEHIPISSLISHNSSSFFKSTFDYDIELKNNKMIDKIRDKQGNERTDILSLYSHAEDKVIYNAHVNGLVYKYKNIMKQINSTILVFQKK